MEHNFDFEALYELLKGRNIRALREKLAGMNVVDTAEFIQELEGEERLIAFRILPRAFRPTSFPTWTAMPRPPLFRLSATASSNS